MAQITTHTQPRIGPCMRAAATYVQLHPGCTKWAAAVYAFGRKQGARQYGYAAVNRAIKAGLIRAEKPNGRRYALYSSVSH